MQIVKLAIIKTQFVIVQVALLIRVCQECLILSTKFPLAVQRAGQFV